MCESVFECDRREKREPSRARPNTVTSSLTPALLAHVLSPSRDRRGSWPSDRRRTSETRHPVQVQAVHHFGSQSMMHRSNTRRHIHRRPRAQQAPQHTTPPRIKTVMRKATYAERGGWVYSYSARASHHEEVMMTMMRSKRGPRLVSWSRGSPDIMTSSSPCRPPPRRTVTPHPPRRPCAQPHAARERAGARHDGARRRWHARARRSAGEGTRARSGKQCALNADTFGCEIWWLAARVSCP